MEKFLNNDNRKQNGKNSIKVKRKNVNKTTLNASKLIPGTTATTSVLSNSVVHVDTLPNQFQNVFKFKTFNQMQSMSFDTLYNSNENCIISSPTGSGKTVLFELAILNLIKDSNQNNINNIKIIYVAPTKSLCQEIYKKWKNQLNFLTVGILTSDTSFLETEKVKKSSIIITTPEKWDLLTRKWHDYIKLFELVRLVLIDEIHTLGEVRGATLEVILTRMKTMCEKIRIVGVSATIPNIEDISCWLKTNNSTPAKILKFDDNFRQVKVNKLVYSYQFYNNNNEFQKDAFYNNKLCDIIIEHSKQKPILIFCPTRSSTVSTAKYLSKNLSRQNHSGNLIKITDSNLKDCYINGVGFHNAGLSHDDRSTIENEFLVGNINILCSTSTLAMGVNLPAYLVIIKGTSIWNNSDYKEYSNLDILQMIGRAGRPQFEKEGCAIIMTENTKKRQYELLIDGKDILESTLHLNLIEHLCSEISLNTIKNSSDAVKWLQHTFFYVRFMKNPNAYWQLKKYLDFSKDPDTQLLNFCKSLLDDLLKENVIEYDHERLNCTAYGKAMVRHYITFETIKKLISFPKMLSLNNTLDLLTKCKEFDQLKLRRNEKRLFKEINLSPLLRFPFLTEKKQSQIIDQSFQKVSLLIQHELGGLEFPAFDWAHKLHNIVVQDKFKIFRHSQRLLKCMIDVFIEKKDAISLNNSMFILRSINGKAWSNTPVILRQLKSIGLISVRKLVNHGITNFDEMSELSESQIEYYLSLKPGGSKSIINDLHSLPKLNLTAKVDNCTFSENGTILATFVVEISAQFSNSSWHGNFLSIDTEIFNSDGFLIDFRRVKLKHLKTPKCFKVDANFSSRDTVIEFVMSCQEISGIEKKVALKNEALPIKWRKELDKTKKLTNLNKYFFVDDSNISSLDTDGEFGNDKEVKKDDVPVCDSLESDDSLMRDLDQASIKKTAPQIPSAHNNQSRRIRSNGNYDCLHSCKDKNNCRHLCCKDGIPALSMKQHHSTVRKDFNRNILKNTNNTSNVKYDDNSKPMLTRCIYKPLKTEINDLSHEDEQLSSLSDHSAKEVDNTSLKSVYSLPTHKHDHSISSAKELNSAFSKMERVNAIENIPSVEEIRIALSSEGCDMSQNPSSSTPIPIYQTQPKDVHPNKTFDVPRLSSAFSALSSSSSIPGSKDIRSNVLDFLGSDVEVS